MKHSSFILMVIFFQTLKLNAIDFANLPAVSRLFLKKRHQLKKIKRNLDTPAFHTEFDIIFN